MNEEEMRKGIVADMKEIRSRKKFLESVIVPISGDNERIAFMAEMMQEAYVILSNLENSLMDGSCFQRNEKPLKERTKKYRNALVERFKNQTEPSDGGYLWSVYNVIGYYYSNIYE